MHESYPGHSVLVGGELFTHSRKTPSNPDNSRLILAFFAAGDPAAGNAAQRAAKSGAYATLNCETAKNNLRGCRYFSLRLQDEQLLIAESRAASLQPVVDEIRSQRPIAVFVIPEAFDNPGDPATTATDPDRARDAARSTAPVASARVSFVRSLLTATESVFGNAVADLTASAALGHSSGPAASWILENGYLVQNEVEEIRRELEGAQSRPIPGANFAQEARWAAVGTASCPARSRR